MFATKACKAPVRSRRLAGAYNSWHRAQCVHGQLCGTQHCPLWLWVLLEAVSPFEGS